MSVIRIEKPIARPAATVWPLLSDFGSIDYFNPHVSESRILEGAPKTGLGAERHCDLKDGRNWVRERVVDWRPGAGYTVDIYEGTMPIEKITTSLGVEPALSTAAGICTGAAAQKCTTGSVVACPCSPWEGPARGATRPRRGWRRPARGRGLWAHGDKRGVIRTVAGVVTGSA